MTEGTLLRDLAVVMAVSGAVTAIFHQLRLPVVLGYVLAGVLIGPHTPPFALVRDLGTIETLAELGVILLLFSIGLEFSLRKLRRVGLVAGVVAAIEIPAMIGLGYTAGRLAGWSEMDALFLGAILSISSTTIIAKALFELRLSQAEFARIILGVLIVEDVAAIVMLVVLSGFASAGTIDPLRVLGAIAGVGLFATSVTIVGFLLAPRLVRWLAGFQVREVLTVSVLGLCFGVAVLAHELGFSVALGAFLVGAVVAETREARRIEERIEPVRDVFSAVFFVAVGMQIDPAELVRSWPVVLGLSVLTIGGKVVTSAFGAFAAGTPPRTALRVGMGLGQIGEFSFIIASLGRSAGVISDFLYPITVGVSALTTLTTPFQIRFSDRLGDWIGRRSPRPLVEFATFYQHALRGLPRRGLRLRLPEGSGWPAAKLVIGAVLVVALLAVAKASATGLGRFGSPFLVVPRDLEIAVWTAWGIASIPLLIGLWRNAGAVASIVARAAGSGRELRALAEGLRFTIAVVGAAIFFAIAGPIFPTGVPFAMISLLVGLAAILFWRVLAGLQQSAERSLHDLLESGGGVAPAEREAAEQDLRSLVSTRYPFDVVLEDFVLPFFPGAANRSIQDLAIRTRTGATVAAIVRDEKTIPNPPPDVRLEPGDVLVLLGSREQVERAMHHLAALAAERG